MITLDDLIARFGEQEIATLTDRDNFAVINEDVVSQAIADAQSEVISYLNAVGLIQFNTNANGESVVSYSKGDMPKVLIVKTCDIARYYLHEDGTIDIVQKRYEDAIKWLKLVMNNPAMLTGITSQSDNDTNGGVHVIPNTVPSIYD